MSFLDILTLSWCSVREQNIGRLSLDIPRCLHIINVNIPRTDHESSNIITQTYFTLPRLPKSTLCSQIHASSSLPRTPDKPSNCVQTPRAKCTINQQPANYYNHVASWMFWKSIFTRPYYPSSSYLTLRKNNTSVFPYTQPAFTFTKS